MYVYLIDNSIPHIFLLNSCTINHSYSQNLEVSKDQAYATLNMCSHSITDIGLNTYQLYMGVPASKRRKLKGEESKTRLTTVLACTFITELS